MSARMEQFSGFPSSPVEFLSLLQSSPNPPYQWLKDLKSEGRGFSLIHLIFACTHHLTSANIKNAESALDYICHLTSADGDAMQRVATYFCESLAHRIFNHWPGVLRALVAPHLSSIHEKLDAQELFFNMCPFMKLSHAITNQAIVEAMEGENMVHIVDLNPVEPSQWIDLFRSFRMRRGGPPHLKITGIHEHREALDKMAAALALEAAQLDIPLEFIRVNKKLEDLDFRCLQVKMGEALAISSILQLHSLFATDDQVLERNSPASSKNLPKVEITNKRTLAELIKMDMFDKLIKSPDSALSPLSLSAAPQMVSFLTTLWKLQPKVMVITEQETELNKFDLMERVAEALKFYCALFDCLESVVPRTSMERKKVEKMLFAEEIKNIIAFEGIERKERHEKLEKWIMRLELAGFRRVPLSYEGMLRATRILQVYGPEKYKLKEKNGCSVICWHDKPLFSVSAWKFVSYN